MTSHQSVHSHKKNFLTMSSEYFLTNFIKWQQMKFQCWMHSNSWYSVILMAKLILDQILKLAFLTIYIINCWGTSKIPNNFVLYGCIFDYGVRQNGIETRFQRLLLVMRFESRQLKFSFIPPISQSYYSWQKDSIYEPRRLRLCCISNYHMHEK